MRRFQRENLRLAKIDHRRAAAASVVAEHFSGGGRLSGVGARGRFADGRRVLATIEAADVLGAQSYENGER
jgi:hypothetical protein